MIGQQRCRLNARIGGERHTYDRALVFDNGDPPGQTRTITSIIDPAMIGAHGYHPILPR